MNIGREILARAAEIPTKGNNDKRQKGQVPVHITQWHLPDQQADYSTNSLQAVTMDANIVLGGRITG